MKPIVLSALLFAATAGTGMANTDAALLPNKNNTALAGDKKSVADFKQVMAFHQRNVDVLWEQYGMAEARIKESRGNHAELDRDKAFFIGVYQQDIDQGLRVEESKKAIAEITSSYAEKHAQRDAYEKKQIAVLQHQLKAELHKEKKRLDKTKKTYASVLNDETIPLLRELEHFLSKAIERANSFGGSNPAIASR